MFKETNHKLLAIHSQSNRPDAPLQFEGDQAEQAYDSRALCLPNLGIVALSSPVPGAYSQYYESVLKLPLPSMVVPKANSSLSQALLHDSEAVGKIKVLQHRSGSALVYSVFDPTDSERELHDHLVKKGVELVPEINFELAQTVGNKAGFRAFCQEYGIPQLPGGVFKKVPDLLQFVTGMQKQGDSVIVKHPNGTAGEGLTVVNADHGLQQHHVAQWTNWITHGGNVVGEVFSKGGTEHSLHIYIDPVTKKAQIAGIYDQLVAKNEDGGFSHYGCKYPATTTDSVQTLQSLAHERVIPALLETGYTGPACFDVLCSPTHFMELNTRAGANMYAHRMVEKVAKAVYGVQETDKVPFIFLSGIKHDIPDFAQFAEAFSYALCPQENGMLIFTNPGRHAFQSYDVIAMSLGTLSEAEGVLYSGLEKIIGAEAAKAAFDKIHQRGDVL